MAQLAFTCEHYFEPYKLFGTTTPGMRTHWSSGCNSTMQMEVKVADRWRGRDRRKVSRFSSNISPWDKFTAMFIQNEASDLNRPLSRGSLFDLACKKIMGSKSHVTICWKTAKVTFHERFWQVVYSAVRSVSLLLRFPQRLG